MIRRRSMSRRGCATGTQDERGGYEGRASLLGWDGNRNVERSKRERLREQLKQTSRDTKTWAPKFFRLSAPEDEVALLGLLEDGPGIQICDVIEEQIADLVKTRNPSEKLSDVRLQDLVRRHIGDTPLEAYGVWVYYPWSRRLVHLLDEAEFIELRTNRNKHKLTAEEQALLGKKRVGVVGLSVGQTVATTMALERSVGEIRLADFDRLDLSNLNRIRSPVYNLGLSKVIMTAREIAEIDPFLRVGLFPLGVHADNISEFLLRGGKLDLLIDECDSIDIKIKLRICARLHRVPVVMETSDRGMIDVERFDREPGRPLFHGLVGNIDPERLVNLTTEEKIPYVLKIIGESTMSTRFAGSLMEIESSIRTWPQLGSAVVYGGGACADVVRRINLGVMNQSGRFYADIEQIVPDDAHTTALPPAAIWPVPPPISREQMLADAARVDPTRRPDEAPLSDELARGIVAVAALAPSGGNVQPWRWLARGGRLMLFHDRSRSEGLTDFRTSGGFVALGAAIETAVLAAHQRGLELAVETFPVPDAPDLVAVLRGLSGPAPDAEPHDLDHLAAVLGERHTNRRLGPRRKLDPAVVAELHAAARSIPGAELRLVQDDAGLAQAGHFIGVNDRLRLLHETLNYEMFREVRWTDAEAETTGDGLHIDSLELSPSDRAGMQMALRRDALAFVRGLGGGRGLEKSAGKAISAASAVALVTMPRTAPIDYLLGGRAVQRVWLAANARGVAMQPMSTLPYFFARLLRGGGEGLGERTIAELRAIRPAYARLFGVRDDDAEVLLFRLSIADPPTLRSLRRPLAEILETA
jgi:nitroreductase/molybdopterin/thiamine biosynthesis adenylyltransferase